MKNLPKDYDWRTRVHYEKFFAEQCAIAVKEHLAMNGFNEEDQDHKAAERIGNFFAACLNALYTGFKQYPDALDDFRVHHPVCSNPSGYSQQHEAEEYQV